MATTSVFEFPADRPAAKRTPFISEGVRQDVETYGKATDPATGAVITKDDLDKYGLRDLSK